MTPSQSTRTPPPVTARRKRPRIPEESRKRVSRACDACRRLKEKCEGGFPCTRCTRLHRNCEFADSSKIAEANSPSRGGSTVDGFSDPDRIVAMEEIIRHYTRLSELDKDTVVHIARSLRSQQIGSERQQSSEFSSDCADHPDEEEKFTIDPVSSMTAIYDGELSHSQFSIHVQRRINEILQHSYSEEIQSVLPNTNSSKASLLPSKSSKILNAAASFPPPEVANFLIDIFFEYAQTNYSYVDEQSLRQNVECFFSHTRQPLDARDASWVCTVLMVFAIGTQFAHFCSRDGQIALSKSRNVVPESSSSPDDDIALTFYHAAVNLIPDVISLASIESVQAFLLLGVYSLPVNAAGLSFTYFGIAIKMAVQNGMHRNYSGGLEARTIELRNRIWWTTYILEKRVCILHGRPVSISKSEVDAKKPSDFPALRADNRVDNLPNVLAMIRLTTILEDARDKISYMRKAPRKSRASVLASVSQLKQDLIDYWNSLPATTYCRDLTPSSPLFRFNVHLALTYHLAHVFIGRVFLFTSPESSDAYTPRASDTLNSSAIRTTLVSGCVQSALDILDLCQTLQDEAGLARASYTEFTSCRAALLVILAQRIHEQSARLRRASEQGIKLIKCMSVGFYAANADKSAIEAMETAIRRLDDGIGHQRVGKAGHSGTVGSAYDQFRNWALLWKNEAVGPTDSANPSSSTFTSDSSATIETPNFWNTSLPQDVGWEMYSPSLPFEVGEFAFMPEMNNQ